MRPWLLAALIVPLACWAHPDNGPFTARAGVLHPIALDHLLALIAVGWIASRANGREGLLLPSLFVGAMALGAGLGLPFSQAQNIEYGIGFSLILMGAVVVFASKIRTLGLLLAPAGLCHGFAHGVGMPVGSSPLAYLAGMVATSIALLVAGTTGQHLASRIQIPVLGRFALSGAMLAAGTFKLLGLA